MATLESLDKNIASMDKKFDVLILSLDRRFEAIDERIEDLAAMTARGFMEMYSRVDSRFEAIEERLETIENNYATKDDLLVLSKNVDLMLDKHIGTFRKDHDALAERTKNLENRVFAS